MTSDLCQDAAVVHITTPQIITTESVVSVSATGNVRLGGGGGGGGSAVELGRRLLLAARAGDTPLVLDLMAKGAPFTTDWLGTSPLHLAASNAHAGTCGVLLRAGVSRDSRTKVERTPLHLAAYSGHATVAALLLEHGALVDCRDMLRMTPLHWAAERGHAACCGVLLRHGADARALSKFHKTPRQLAAARRHQHVLALIDDALQQPTPAPRAILPEQPATETAEPQRQNFTTVHRVQEIKIKPKPPQEKQSKAEIKIETSSEKSPSGSGSGAAAQLLRRHGITLLPADDGSTLLNALQSGRTVVLSDAGKLMLKESGDASAGVATAPPAAGVPGGVPAGAGVVGAGGATAGAARGRGVVLTATPVRAPPPGVKVFTLNNRLLANTNTASAAATVTTATIAGRALHDNQVKFVQLPADARVVSPRKAVRARRVLPLGAKDSQASGAGPASAAGSVSSAGARAPVKIIMNKSNFQRLVAGARHPEPAATPAVVVATPQLPTSEAGDAGADTDAAAGADDAATLRLQLAAAQRAVSELAQQLQDARARLLHYEPAP